MVIIVVGEYLTNYEESNYYWKHLIVKLGGLSGHSVLDNGGRKPFSLQFIERVQMCR